MVVGLFAIHHGAPVDVALPAMLLAPLLAEHLPVGWTARADEDQHVRKVEGVNACRYLQRLATLHTSLVQATEGSDRYDPRRSAEFGHNLLWDTAGLLQTHDTLSASEASSPANGSCSNSPTKSRRSPSTPNARTPPLRTSPVSPDGHWTRTRRASARRHLAPRPAQHR
ncbi:hypothetical protein ACFYNL_38290 [Streptomyces sp. NPDC007808]|uniref:hypothetical protein n=1 Tax=Streptomyces sp. NPDC007808 TaxID=3364779 RepID=UPI0036B3A306